MKYRTINREHNVVQQNDTSSQGINDGEHKACLKAGHEVVETTLEGSEFHAAMAFGK